ncbi:MULTISPECIES: hypothetical protein [Aerosakkonema]|uniref:hypothetical protein n=1 Tax=Aerosakkonema TaxID=1246629 RepID=UPI0035B92606
MTFKKLLSVGEVITLETSVKLNFAEAIQIPDGDNPYNLLIDFPAWLPDVNVKIWEVLEMPAFSLTGSSIIGTRKGVPVRTPVNASTTAVALLAARTGRVGLDIINESAGVMYVRYAVVASPASATTKDAVVPPNTTYEFPGLPPESAINAVWTIGTGSCTVVEWTET